MQPQPVVKERIEMPKVVTSLNGRSPSSKFINRIVLGIILLIVFIQIGFFKTYLQHFPKFEEYTAGRGNTRYTLAMHIHGMLMMGWVWMLLLQPILIRKGKIKLHRRIGSLSYVLVPLMLGSLYLVNQDQFHSLSAREGTVAAITQLAISLPEGLFFVILYSLAIFYKHRPALHMRFMCSTAFLFINPALGRMFRTWFDLPGFGTSSPITISLAGIVTIVDSWRTKRVSPFALVFALVLFHRIIWELRDTPFWQTTGGFIARMF